MDAEVSVLILLYRILETSRNRYMVDKGKHDPHSLCISLVE